MTGRIIVDAFGFGKLNPNLSITVTAIKSEESDVPGGTARRRSSSDNDGKKRRPSSEEQLLHKNEIQAKRQHLLLMSPMLAGYSLKLKKWREYPSSCPWETAKKNFKFGYALTKSGHWFGMKTLMIILSFRQTIKVSFYHLSRTISNRAKRLTMLLPGKASLTRD